MITEERRAYNRAYYAANRDKIRTKSAAYRAAHLDEYNARNAAWRESHRDEYRSYMAAYRAANREKFRVRDAAYHSAHREERSAYNRAYREMHREKLKARYDENIPQIRAWAAARTERVRILLRDLKGRPCSDCGGSFPPECMDFDHVRGEKRADIARLAHYKGAVLEAELAKCELVCANCHRIRTVARRRAKKTA